MAFSQLGLSIVGTFVIVRLKVDTITNVCVNALKKTV